MEDDMVRQILSIEFDASSEGGTVYIGTQSAGVARATGVNDVISGNGPSFELEELEWEWINDGLGPGTDRIVPELRIRNNKLYCLLTGDSPNWTNAESTGVYEWNSQNKSWIRKRGTINYPPELGNYQYDLWEYPTSFEVDQNGNIFLVDIEKPGNYLASGIWKSSDDGQTWSRQKQFTFPYHITSVGDRIYASGARSIARNGIAGWGDGGLLHSDDGGETWIKNEDMPLLSNGNSMVLDPLDSSKLFYTFFGGGILHGPVP